MKFIEQITQIDKKFAWSFLGVLLAIFGFWYTRDNPANVKVELLSKARVYDIHADVPNLAILFNSENIKEKKQVLTFFTVRISNPGGRPITQNLYDTSLPFGIQLINGRAFPPDLVDASQKYLSENLKPSLVGENQITFEKVVIDAGARFTVRFLVLHGQGLDPYITPVGKIAGVSFNGQPVTVETDQGANPPFWRQVLAGSLPVHVVRFCVYIFALIAFVLAIVLPVAAIDSVRTNRKKKKTSCRFQAYQGARDSTYSDLLAGIAVDSGAKGLLFASRLHGLRVSARRLRRTMDPYGDSHGPIHLEGPFVFTMPLIGTLEKAGVLEEKAGVFSLNTTFRTVLEDFRVFWQATEPTDPKDTERFVGRTIQWLEETQSRPSKEDATATDGNDVANGGAPDPGSPHDVEA